MGAAILAGALANPQEELKFIDVLPSSIGLGLPGGRYQPVLKRGTKIPAEHTFHVATVRDDQPTITVFLFRGEDERVEQNTYLGTLKLESFEPGPRGGTRYRVTLRVDGEGILDVRAENLATQAMEKRTLSVLETDEDIRSELEIPLSEPVKFPSL